MKSLRKYIVEMVTGKRPLTDIYFYFEGTYRYKLYYSTYGKNTRHPLMREHIHDQINYRIKVMREECYDSGSCVMCGCETTALQMASKRCKGKCYPHMVNKRHWEGKYPIPEDDGIWLWKGDKYVFKVYETIKPVRNACNV